MADKDTPVRILNTFEPDNPGTLIIRKSRADGRTVKAITAIKNAAPEVLAEYRLHSNSITGQSFLSGQNLKDISKVIDKVSSHLPSKDQKAYNKLAKKRYAEYALKTALSLWFKTKNKEAADIQIRQALSLHNSFSIVAKAELYKFVMKLPHNWLPVLNKLNHKFS